MAQTDTQRALEIIREKIITTEMPPGSVILETELINQLGFGRTPIREALKLLEAQRLVHVAPRRGMFVTTINLGDLSDIQEIRSVLDVLCVRLASQRILPEELAKLQDIVSEAKLVAASGDVERLLALDECAHRTLAEAAHNPLLQSEMETLYDLSLRIWHFYLDQMRPEDLAFDALEEVIDAIARRDSRKAERAMTEHISHFGDTLKRRL
ncbi:MAG TPA: GntR family transcriptional regulator [Anaerolineae bacterium]